MRDPSGVQLVGLVAGIVLCVAGSTKTMVVLGRAAADHPRARVGVDAPYERNEVAVYEKIDNGSHRYTALVVASVNFSR